MAEVNYWTEADEAKVKDLLMNKGMSAAQVAAQFPGPTRNSIISLAHRKKFGGRGLSASGTRNRREVESAKRIKAAREKVTKPRHALRSPLGYAVDVEVKEPAFELLKADTWKPLPGSFPRPLEELENGCKWPVGEAPFLFCCEPKAVVKGVEHKSYCHTHARMAVGNG